VTRRDRDGREKSDNGIDDDEPNPEQERSGERGQEVIIQLVRGNSDGGSQDGDKWGTQFDWE
jgi:hypothetical protein